MQILSRDSNAGPCEKREHCASRFAEQGSEPGNGWHRRSDNPSDIRWSNPAGIRHPPAAAASSVTEELSDPLKTQNTAL